MRKLSRTIYSLIFAGIGLFLPSVCPLFPSDIDLPNDNQVNLNTSVSNTQDDLIIPYRPGVDYDRMKLGDYGSVRSLFPSSSVSVKSQGTPGQLSTVSLDGGPAPHTAIALDGMPVETAQITPLDIGILPTEFFQSADVYRNNMGPYGYTGSSGMINFNLFRPGMNENQLQLYGGSYSSFGGKMLVSQSVGDLDFLIGGAYSSASNNFIYIDSWNSTNTAANLDFTKYSLIAKMQYRDIKVNMTYSSREAGAGPGIARQNDNLLTADADYKTGGFQADLSYVNWLNRYRDPVYSQNDTHLNQTINLRLGGDMGWDFYRFKPGLNNKLFLADSTKIGSRTDDEINLVLENLLTFGPLDLNVTLNQVYRISGGYIPVPALDATLKVFGNFRLIGGISRAFRYPTFNDLYWPEDSFSAGNPGLKSEDGVGWKTGLIAFFYPFYASATYSETYLNDLIVWRPDLNGKWSPQNIARMSARVLTLAANWDSRFGKFTLKADASFSMNYSVNNDETSDFYLKRIVYTPLYKTSAGITAEFDKWIGFNARFRHVSESFTTEANTVWLPPCTLVDARMNISFVFLAVENIFDVNYREIQGYPQPGRTFRAGIDWVF